MGADYIAWVGYTWGAGAGAGASLLRQALLGLSLRLRVGIEFGEVTGCGVGRLRVAAGVARGHWVAGLHGVLVWESGGGRLLESANGACELAVEG